MEIFASSLNEEEFARKYCLTEEQLECLHKESAGAGVKQSSAIRATALAGERLDAILARKKMIIDAFIKQEKHWSGAFFFPYLLFLTDEQGMVLCLQGEQESLREAKRNGIGIGVSLGLHNMGTNAVSAAIKLERPVFMNGKEHYQELFYHWSCLCLPIYDSDRKIAAYLDFSTSHQIHGSFVHPVALTIAHAIEKELIHGELALDDCTEAAYFRDALKKFSLTAREREIAGYWLLDYNHKQISRALGISESTVRRHIEKIYAKMSVNTKASMHLKVRGML